MSFFLRDTNLIMSFYSAFHHIAVWDLALPSFRFVYCWEGDNVVTDGETLLSFNQTYTYGSTKH